MRWRCWAWRSWNRGDLQLSRLEQASAGQWPDKPFLRLLADPLGDREGSRVLHTLIDWARHGEVFEYNGTTRQFSLPDDEDDDELPA